MGVPGLQISGGNKYLPPRQDVNAPDLYIPLCAVATYVLMAATVAVGHKRFSPATMYSLVRTSWLITCTLVNEAAVLVPACMSRLAGSSPASKCYDANLTRVQACLQASHAGGAWLLHTVLLKALLYLLGLAAAVPFLELACYAGYPFVAVCLAMAAAALPVSLGA